MVKIGTMSATSIRLWPSCLRQMLRLAGIVTRARDRTGRLMTFDAPPIVVIDRTHGLHELSGMVIQQTYPSCLLPKVGRTDLCADGSVCRLYKLK